MLSDADAERYREIFAAQRQADFKAADRLIARLDDPLLFVELIPSGQTRRYVRRVADAMIYRHRLGRPAPELRDIAQGRWPRYLSKHGDRAPSPEQETRHAWNR